MVGETPQKKVIGKKFRPRKGGEPTCHLALDPECDVEEAIDYGQHVCDECVSFGASTH